MSDEIDPGPSQGEAADLHDPEPASGPLAQANWEAPATGDATPLPAAAGQERAAETTVLQPDSFRNLIERWWEDHFPGSAVARYTEAWNVAYSAKEALKRLLQRGN